MIFDLLTCNYTLHQIMWLAIFFIISILFSYYRWRKFCKHDPNSTNIIERTPGPAGIPFVGSTWKLRSTREAFVYVDKICSEFGKTVRMNLSFIPTICTYDYDFVKFLLGTNEVLMKSRNYKWVRPWLGTGLITADGDAKWHRHRKLITPAFHFEILKHYIKSFERSGDILIRKLRDMESSWSSLDVHPILKLYTLDIINETAMGVQMNAQDGKAETYVKDVDRMCRIIVERGLSVLKMFDNSFVLTLDYYLQQQSLKRLQTFTRNVINDRIKQKNAVVVNNKPIEGSRMKMVLLDTLLKSDGLTIEEIREEVDTFMFAGHDTTATAISFILYCISNHPRVQENLIQEQLDLFGELNFMSDAVPLTYETLSEMRYLEMVIKESLRLYPVVPVIGRITSKHVMFGDIFIPKGLDIGIYVYALHRDPDNFENPNDFIPERFEHPESIAPFAYVPFSAGARNCIGQKFAMLEMKSTVSKIIRHFELGQTNPKHELDLATETVIKSLNGIKMSIKSRHQQ